MDQQQAKQHKRNIERHKFMLANASKNLAGGIRSAIGALEMVSTVAYLGMEAIAAELETTPDSTLSTQMAITNDDLGGELSAINSTTLIAMQMLAGVVSDLNARDAAFQERRAMGLNVALVELLKRNPELVESTATTMAIRSMDQDVGTEAARHRLNDLLGNEPE